MVHTSCRKGSWEHGEAGLLCLRERLLFEYRSWRRLELKTPFFLGVAKSLVSGCMSPGRAFPKWVLMGGGEEKGDPSLL
jgi:hypothetical protein